MRKRLRLGQVPNEEGKSDYFEINRILAEGFPELVR